MLTSLSLRDVVLIDKLDLPLGPGLTVLTGETGAGKSILLDGLGLALGGRAEAGLVRTGAAQAVATACFHPPAGHPVAGLLAEHGLDEHGQDGEDGLVLRRIVGSDGRSRALINDQPVGVALLRRVGAMLVEVQGQHDQQGLADAATHRAVLDGFGVPAGLVLATEAAWAGWRAADIALQETRPPPSRRPSRTRSGWNTRSPSWTSLPPKPARRRRWPPTAPGCSRAKSGRRRSPPVCTNWPRAIAAVRVPPPRCAPPPARWNAW